MAATTGPGQPVAALTGLPGPVAVAIVGTVLSW